MRVHLLWKQRGGEERQAAAGVPADPQAAADPEGHLALPAHRRRYLQRAQSAAAGFPQPVRPPTVRPRPTCTSMSTSPAGCRKINDYFLFIFQLNRFGQFISSTLPTFAVCEKFVVMEINNEEKLDGGAFLNIWMSQTCCQRSPAM